ncbi:MAG TPA: carboxypeptidase-like regulatory domain-containing protein, partial [Opitutales bacterium]|nr:carboxypeptidase-like regulatory domain-containing protein [Opitutales bacterium]
IPKNGDLDAAKLVGYQYSLVISGNSAGHVAENLRGEMIASSFGRNAEPNLPKIITMVGALPQIASGTYEARLLRFQYGNSAFPNTVLWLKAESGDGDFIYTFQSLAVPTIRPLHLYPAKDFVKEVLTIPVGNLTGQVVDPRNHPVADLDVFVCGMGVSQTVHTDADGNFTLEDLTQSPNVLIATARGYAGETPVTTFRFKATSRLSKPIQLMPAGSIQGSVRDPRGQPMPGAVVAFIQPYHPVPSSPIDDPQKGLHPQDLNTGGTAIATTDSQGQFVIPALPPGQYIVTAAVHPDGAPTMVGSLQPITVLPGVPTKVAQAIRLQATGSLTGSAVVQHDGAPAAGVAISAFKDNTYQEGINTVTDDQGLFVLPDLSPGSYTVEQMPFGSGPPLKNIVIKPGVETKLPKPFAVMSAIMAN